jgi:hypothetical protein
MGRVFRVLFTFTAASATRDASRLIRPIDADKFATMDLAGPCNIDRRPDLTRDEFLREYRGRKPVVLGGAAWAAERNSSGRTMDELMARFGEYPVPLYHPYGRAFVGVHVRKMAGECSGHKEPLLWSRYCDIQRACGVDIRPLRMRLRVARACAWAESQACRRCWQ